MLRPEEVGYNILPIPAGRTHLRVPQAHQVRLHSVRIIANKSWAIKSPPHQVGYRSAYGIYGCRGYVRHIGMYMIQGLPGSHRGIKGLILQAYEVGVETFW